LREQKRKARSSPWDSPSAGRREAVHARELLPEASVRAADDGDLGLVPGFGLAATFFAGLSPEGGSFFAGLSPAGSVFAGPLPLRLGACEGRFFLEGGAGWACFGLPPPRPNRRCKKCKKASLTVSPRGLQ
jgi:hypothetical protein